MFSVYGVTGRVFTGTMEQLRHIDKVHAIARMRRIEPNDMELLPELQNPPVEPATSAPMPLLPSTAVAAYAQTSQPDTPRQPLDRVGLLMTQPAVTTRADTSLAEAADLMAQHRIAQVPVLDANARLVGILLRADLFRPGRVVASTPDAAVPLDANDWAVRMAQPVSGTMWTPVASVSSDTDIRRVAQVLLDTGLPGLPVVDEGGTVIGFVSRTDILRAVATEPPLDVWG
ncbi:CBS domain-containing protein [Rhodoferax ferrireducens]|jgi:CBS domain-containing protein|uniref:CBS domain-containing protein n=1 Tax=Rhodoferax ferrireducens TaxID=192843 RepID=A0ABU2C2Y6_9BURK|nr:CBS domain-containing protein [Rhodoferax ferrireducens]MDR7375696.1 CBS domain-containing protein [Rhodoferax ferrireducens]